MSYHSKHLDRLEAQITRHVQTERRQARPTMGGSAKVPPTARTTATLTNTVIKIASSAPDDFQTRAHITRELASEFGSRTVKAARTLVFRRAAAGDIDEETAIVANSVLHRVAQEQQFPFSAAISVDEGGSMTQDILSSHASLLYAWLTDIIERLDLTYARGNRPCYISSGPHAGKMMVGSGTYRAGRDLPLPRFAHGVPCSSFMAMALVPLSVHRSHVHLWGMAPMMALLARSRDLVAYADERELSADEVPEGKIQYERRADRPIFINPPLVRTRLIGVLPQQREGIQPASPLLSNGIYLFRQAPDPGAPGNFKHVGVMLVIDGRPIRLAADSPSKGVQVHDPAPWHRITGGSYQYVQVSTFSGDPPDAVELLTGPTTA